MPTSTTRLGLVKPFYSENLDVAVLNANMDKIEAQLPVIGRFVRAVGDGQQTLNSGDQLLQFTTTAVESNYGSFITPQGSPASSFLLQPGCWTISAAIRLDVVAAIGLFITEGTSADETKTTSMSGLSGGVVDFQCAASINRRFTVATSVGITLWRGATACKADAFGLGATHVSFHRTGPA